MCETERPGTTIHGKILAGEKLANRELFAKNFLANIYTLID